jgi:hypothetical protein
MIAEQIQAQIAKLTEEKRNLEINMHRIDAALWAFNETLKMLEPKSTELKAEDPPVEVASE